MEMADRSGSVGNYRYGFQGQEKDDEIKGEGNSINYKFRMHDPRLGRFFAVDPLAVISSGDSPYMFAGNSPIFMVDVEGLYKYPVTVNYNGHTYLLEFNSRNTQKVKIKLVGEGRERWQSIEYKTRNPLRLKKGLASIGLLKSYTANTIAEGGDVNIMYESFWWSSAGFRVDALKVINAALDEDNGVSLNIIGGHRISGNHPDNRGNNDRAFKIEHFIFIHGCTAIILPILKTYHDSPWFSDEFQNAFNTMRAKTVQNAFFKDVDNVNAISRQDFRGGTAGSVTLPKYNQDPIGVTLSFEFKKPKLTKTPKKSPPVQKSKNPRFL